MAYPSSWDAIQFGAGQVSPLVENAPSNLSVSVTGTAAIILPANNLVRRRVFTNTSTTATCYLAFNGNTAALSTGETLLPGTTLEMTPQCGNLNQGEVSAIGSSNLTLAVKEEY